MYRSLSKLTTDTLFKKKCSIINLIKSKNFNSSYDGTTFHYNNFFNYAYVMLLSIGITFSNLQYVDNKSIFDANDNKMINIDNEQYTSIIIGGGTAGCTTAYLLAKWMDDNNIPGNVLLIDRGVDFTPKLGPSPRIALWYENWCEFGEAHDSMNRDGTAYPVVPSDHKGLGGCSTHDTRITFQLRHEQQLRIAKSMGWSHMQLMTYYQAALNLMPMSPSISNEKPIPFYNSVLETLTNKDNTLSNNNNNNNTFITLNAINPTNPSVTTTTSLITTKESNRSVLHGLDNHEHKTEINIDTIAKSTLAIYEDDKVVNENDIRWTAAYLIDDSIRPKSLKIITNATVDKILFEKYHHIINTASSINRNTKDDNKEEEGVYEEVLVATGVKIHVDNKEYIIKINKQLYDKFLPNNSIDNIGEIILTSGSIGSPAILQRSGIGSKTLLDRFGIPVLINNPYVGHGIDHEEIAILYEWLDKWNDIDTNTVPRGGAMGWPIVLFASFLANTLDYKTKHNLQSDYFEAHFGAGYAEPYTSFPSVVVTPSCIRPDHSSLDTGFLVEIQSLDPKESCLLIQGNHQKDLETMALAVLSVSSLFQTLIQHQIIGKQIEPEFEIKYENMNQLIDWIKSNHYTVFHWACTCQSGLYGRVTDEQFRLRFIDNNIDNSTTTTTINNNIDKTNTNNNNKDSTTTNTNSNNIDNTTTTTTNNNNNNINNNLSRNHVDNIKESEIKKKLLMNKVIPNLRIGSAASLPELSEANPHLTITAFSIALVDIVSYSLAKKYNTKDYHKPIEINKAYSDLIDYNKHILNNNSINNNNKNNINSNNNDNNINNNDKIIHTIMRRPGEEIPSLSKFAKQFSNKWDQEHS